MQFNYLHKCILASFHTLMIIQIANLHYSQLLLPMFIQGLSTWPFLKNKLFEKMYIEEKKATEDIFEQTQKIMGGHKSFQRISSSIEKKIKMDQGKIISSVQNTTST